MSEDEKKAIDMLEKYITEHKFYNIKQSDGLEDNIKILLDLYMQEKERAEELLKDREKSTEEYIHNNPWLYKQLAESYILKLDVKKDYISKDKIKPFIKAIESWADYIQEDEGCYYKGLNKLAQKLNDTLDGKITPNEKELCVEYELLE